MEEKNNLRVVIKYYIASAVLFLVSAVLCPVFIYAYKLHGLRLLLVAPLAIMTLACIVLCVLLALKKITTRFAKTAVYTALAVSLAGFLTGLISPNLLINHYETVFQHTIAAFDNVDLEVLTPRATTPAYPSKIVILSDDKIDRVFLDVQDEIKAKNEQQLDYVVKLVRGIESGRLYADSNSIVAHDQTAFCDIFVFKPNDNKHQIYGERITDTSTIMKIDDEAAYSVPNALVIERINQIFYEPRTLH